MKLGLPFSELQELYTRHLILTDFLVIDVSLYILSLLFQYKKQQAFDIYDNAEIDSLPFLEALEDRFINGIVLYRIALRQHDNNKFKQAFDIFKRQKNLSPQELFYMAVIYENGLGIEKNINKAIILYEMSGERGHIKAFYNLGYIYRNKMQNENAILYFEKAINIPEAKCYLAYLLEFGYGVTKNNERAKKLYKEAAKDNEFARLRCKELNI
jgi:TPR repeat protein